MTGFLENYGPLHGKLQGMEWRVQENSRKACDTFLALQLLSKCECASFLFYDLLHCLNLKKGDGKNYKLLSGKDFSQTGKVK